MAGQQTNTFEYDQRILHHRHGSRRKQQQRVWKENRREGKRGNGVGGVVMGEAGK